MAERGHSRQVDGEREFTFRNVQLFKNETLGTGSYGAVCKARCDQLICAAKLVHPVLIQTQAIDPGKEHRHPFHRFEQECRFLSCVNHPNIVQYLGTYHDPETNTPVLLMELMDESLTHFLESLSGDTPFHIQVNLSQDIAQALAFLHANGIIHRDLSSNNVLLIAGTRAKVSDFGMLKITSMNTTHLATMTASPGTPAFMSPEALDEPPRYTEKLDNFSFGVLLVQITTRQFPKPTNRFRRIKIQDPPNSSQMTEARVPIPEVQRRQAHISLIEFTHPLLPMALECLKDEAEDRPSSLQLCQSLDDLKTISKYDESLQQDRVQLLQAPLQQKNQQLQTKDPDLEVLRQEKDEHIQEKDIQLIANKALQHEVESKEQQLRRLNEQLEPNEEFTATLQHTITQKREREIAELRELLPNKDCEKVTPNSEAQLNMTWETLRAAAPESFDCVSAAVGDKVYFKSESDDFDSIWEFCTISSKWNKLPDHPLRSFTLVSIENELTTVGGVFTNWLWKVKDSNQLYSFIEGKWVEKYPPMPTKRWGCTAVYESPLLIVAGSYFDTLSGSIFETGVAQLGLAHLQLPVPAPGETVWVGEGMSKATAVEILNIHSKQWSKVSSVPFPAFNPSLSICEEYTYLARRDNEPYLRRSKAQYSVVRCSLLPLVLSTASNPTIWKEIASLPVKYSTLVVIKGHLLAVGGVSTKGDHSKDIYQYNAERDLWNVISRMNIARSHCAVALMPGNKLIVVGGNTEEDQIELASVL